MKKEREEGRDGREEEREGEREGRRKEWRARERKEKNCIYRDVFTRVICRHTTLKTAQILPETCCIAHCIDPWKRLYEITLHEKVDHKISSALRLQLRMSCAERV